MEEHPVSTNSAIMPEQQESDTSQQASLSEHRHDSTPLYATVGDLFKPAINTALPGGDEEESLSSVVVTFQRQRNSESMITEGFSNKLTENVPLYQCIQPKVDEYSSLSTLTKCPLRNAQLSSAQKQIDVKGMEEKVKQSEYQALGEKGLPPQYQSLHDLYKR
jgi:hypothetical protein